MKNDVELKGAINVVLARIESGPSSAFEWAAIHATLASAAAYARECRETCERRERGLAEARGDLATAEATSAIQLSVAESRALACIEQSSRTTGWAMTATRDVPLRVGEKLLELQLVESIEPPPGMRFAGRAKQVRITHAGRAMMKGSTS